MDISPPRRRRLLVIGTAGLLSIGLVAGGIGWLAQDRERSPESVPTPTARSTSPATPAVPPAERKMLAGIDALLAARSAAVLSGRLPQFMERVDATNRALRLRQRQLYANLRKLGLRSLAYDRQPEWVPEAQPQHGRGAYAVRLFMLLQIGGVDRAPWVTSLAYTFAERGGRWLLVDDDDLDGQAGAEEHNHQPWDLGPMEVIRRPGVVVATGAGDRAYGTRLAREAGIAMPAVRAATRRAPAGIFIVAVKDRRSFLDDWRTGGHPAAAVAVPNWVRTGPRDQRLVKPGSCRVVVNPADRNQADRLLLAHEFTHAATCTLGHGAPIWLVEGFAEYVENHLAEQSGYRRWVADRRRELLRKAVPALTVLPIDGVFHGDYDEDTYGVSWVITEYLVTRYGLSKVNALYAALAAGPDDPDARERTMRAQLGLGEAALVAAVKKYDGPR
jgi:hypothetical protein